MNINFLDFEQPIAELEAKIEELRLVGSDTEINISEEISRLEYKSKELSRSIFKSLSAWQIVQLARHPLRPYTLDYIDEVFTHFDELHGDRTFADDKSIIAGIARLDKQAVMVIGQQKGRGIREKVVRNFGMPHPEGYRKALRLMRLAEQFSLPIITLIDTPGAYPGVGAEARGQCEAIAKNIQIMSHLKVPVICVVIGEACSGGALGIGVGDKVMIFQYAYFATISPEGCASILWKRVDKAVEAAESMQITAECLLKLKLIDEIIPEPLGGAHRNPKKMYKRLKQVLLRSLEEISSFSVEKLLDRRYERLMRIGVH